MSEKYDVKDMGVLVNETDQAVDTYQLAQKIPMRSEHWGRFSIDLTLVASKFRINARASASTPGYTNAMNAFFNLTEILESGFYELVIPTNAYDLELEWETTNATNVTKVAFTALRPDA